MFRFVLILVLLLVGSLWAGEPSAFELQSGATKKELQDIKRRVESHADEISSIERQLKNIETSLEGLRSIYEGQSVNIKEVHDKINNADSYATKEDVESLQQQISSNTKNLQVLADGLKNVSDSIAQIQDILQRAINGQSGEKPDSNKQESDEKVEKAESMVHVAATTDEQTIKEQASEASNESSNKGNEISFSKDTTRRGDIFKEARSLTYAKKFDEAIARYNWFIEIDYKKAESNYMLGNIAYEQNRYTNAISYYKESALLDDKAGYIPRLLLNSANSFRVLKDIENAKKFYNSLISSFPDSSEAKEAKKQLDKLK